MSLLATFPEIDASSGSLHIRHDLTNQCVTIGLIDFDQWDVDTVEVKISPQLINFIEPDKTLVGIKVFSVDGAQSGGIS